jgi:capsule biosynthesis phosphatase
MKFVLLCGGRGTRLEGFDLPKPLCTIRGKSLVYHVLEALPETITDIIVFYNMALDRVQFQKHIIHTCHELKKQLSFVRLTADTKGPVETAYACLHKMDIDPSEPILFFDNDSINKFSLSDIEPSYLSLGTFYTQNKTLPYSFVDVSNGNVIAIKEKEGISNTYCTGLYYFPSITTFYALRERLLNEYPTKSEYFMSDLYSVAIAHDMCVRTFSCIDNVPLGTRQDIQANIHRVKTYPMRICFDIDNTILTNSTSKGSQDGIEPIPEMVELIQTLHKSGNTIVLATARSMETCNSNPGAAAKRGMMSVLKKLDEYDIPYDEIYFGKPWAHVYVDDRAWNQYTNPTFPEFMFSYKSPLRIERGCSNNQNVLYKKDRILVKEGPESSLEGEIFFYKHAPALSLFPTYYRSSKNILEIEFIEGQTVSSLFRNYLLTPSLIRSVFDALQTLYAVNVDSPQPSPDDVYDNYIGNLERHMAKTPDIYKDLPDIESKLSCIRNQLKEYVYSHALCFKSIVHGDYWFDNILVTSAQTVHMIDMRGKVGQRFTLKGDPMLDYAKLYQSILGFDFAIHNEAYRPEYEERCRSYLSNILPISLEEPVLEALTACCILKSFFYFSDASRIRPTYALLDKLKLFNHNSA